MIKEVLILILMNIFLSGCVILILAAVIFIDNKNTKILFILFILLLVSIILHKYLVCYKWVLP